DGCGRRGGSAPYPAALTPAAGARAECAGGAGARSAGRGERPEHRADCGAHGAHRIQPRGPRHEERGGPATTSALQSHPYTALDLLFGPGNDTSEALARQLMSADTGRDLGRALEELPRATREAAVRETTAAAAGLLNVDLFGGLVAGWRKHHDLTAAAQR